MAVNLVDLNSHMARLAGDRRRGVIMNLTVETPCPLDKDTADKLHQKPVLMTPVFTDATCHWTIP